MARLLLAAVIVLVLLGLVLAATGRVGPQELGIVLLVVLAPTGLLVVQRLRR